MGLEHARRLAERYTGFEYVPEAMRARQAKVERHERVVAAIRDSEATPEVPLTVHRQPHLQNGNTNQILTVTNMAGEHLADVHLPAILSEAYTHLALLAATDGMGVRRR